MVMLRTTILIDEWVAGTVRQQFSGNLSNGINTLLQEHLQEKRKPLEGFGMFKGRGLRSALKKMRKEERLMEEERLGKMLRG